MELIHGDAFEQLNKMIKNGVRVDALISDPPYGTIQGMQLQGSKHKVGWDVKIDWDEFFDKAFQVTDTVILFGQQPTWSQVIVAGAKYYKEELIWVKNKSAQGFHAKTMHLKFFENIGVFRKGKGTFNLNKNPKLITDDMPLRQYAQQVMLELDIPRGQIHKRLGHRALEFFLFYRGTSFNPPSKVKWDQFCEEFKGDFPPKTYEELMEMKKLDKSIKVKLDANFSDTLRNVLIFDKDKGGLHPTQKPLALMEYLIITYTNEGDTILDPFMGGGTTPEAAFNTNRHCIGVEKTKQYYDVSVKRINELKK